MREKLIYALGAAAAILLVRNLNVILNVLPDEAQQGAMYRIMFFHIPSWWFSIRWWRTQHPQPMVLPPDMWRAVLSNWLFLILLMIVFVLLRLRQEEMRRDIDGLRRQRLSNPEGFLLAGVYGLFGCGV